ncbi:hypothetical protein MVEN_02215400 [Mycena venus]|uniref:Uncharacterized protein n=1 Tax=Mycena venus TaxID=2733690 RepID=A0A8H7CHH2_9AGAR|nr:hypothetical protein MVEN_02215400 [Mycena venus]
MAAVPELGFEPELEIIDLTGETTASEDGEGDKQVEKDEDGPNEASRAQLRAAIYRVPEACLRHMLVGFADTVPAVYHALARELVVTYDVNADEDEECTFHPGELQVNEAKFPD